jgi:hypothetical protein
MVVKSPCQFQAIPTFTDICCSICKDGNTFKISVTVLAACIFMHASDNYVGSISDDDIVEACKILGLIPRSARIIVK